MNYIAGNSNSSSCNMNGIKWNLNTVDWNLNTLNYNITNANYDKNCYIAENYLRSSEENQLKCKIII